MQPFYRNKDNKQLRCGYTTGSCAAAAAKAAAVMLFTDQELRTVSLLTPSGKELELNVLHIKREKNSVSCAIKKDSGDDPDVTNGILVYAEVCRRPEPFIKIKGGTGVGRVTRAGLEQPVGAAAINSVPRSMIKQALEEVCEELEYSGGIMVEISIPEGIEIAKKTFNPRLGIEGGISVLGTSGIVEPMSESALLTALLVEMRVLKAAGTDIIIATPGHYGENYTRNHLTIGLQHSIKCSNFIGDIIDYAVELDIKGILLIGHIGKFIKLAVGIMNTHSRNADARMETMTAYAAMAGAETDVLKQIMGSATTDEGIRIIKEAGILEETMKLLMDRIDYYLKKRTYGKIEIGAVVFSNQWGFLGETADVSAIMEQINEQDQVNKKGKGEL